MNVEARLRRSIGEPARCAESWPVGPPLLCMDDHALGSIEYAVEHLGSRLIVVLGHERCGAVKAALASATPPGHVNSLVRVPVDFWIVDF